MNRKLWLFFFVIFGAALNAVAADVGGHIGYYGSDVQMPAIGVDLRVPIGMIAIGPNLDYTREKAMGLWLASADFAARFGNAWIGIGPAYKFETHDDGSYGGEVPDPGDRRRVSHLTAAGTEAVRPWGWDVNGGLEFSGSLRTYVVGRYHHVGTLKTAGIAVGIRFGR